MNEKLTSFKMTTSCKKFQDELIKETGIKKNAFQKKAIDYFLASNHEIKEELKITNFKDECYISKQAKEQIILNSDQRAKLEKIAIQNDVGITTVLFQCMVDFCLFYYKNQTDIDKERLLELLSATPTYTPFKGGSL